jgi:uncharacterized protein (TIGR04141 family)
MARRTVGERRITYSLYLLTQDCTAAPDALRPEARYREVATRLDGVRAFLAPPTVRRPEWAVALADQVDGLDALHSSPTGLVVVAPAGGRLVALTFSNGWKALDPDRYEWGFGLQLGAGTLASDGLRQTEARRLDATARTRLTSYAQDQPVDLLALDMEGDWVRRLSGRTTSGDGSPGELVRATDSYQFRGPARLTALLTEVERLLTIWSDARGSAAFSFLDNFRPVQRGSAVTAELDAELLGLLEREELDDVAFAPAESLDPTAVDRYVLRVGTRTVELPDLEPGPLLRALRGAASGLAGPFGRARLSAVDHDGDVVAEPSPLRRWIVAERRHDDAVHVLNAGRWFVMARRYVEHVEEQIRAIPDVTAELALPPWPASLPVELDYNRHAAAADPRLLCLDQQTARADDARSPVEFCDLLRDDGTFIHVKKAERSQSLSHLWAQGQTSAQLLNGNDASYRAALRRLLDEQAPGHPVAGTLRPSRVVYAVATADARPVHDTLFTLAKVSLLSYRRDLHFRLGTPVGLAKIQRPRKRR